MNIVCATAVPNSTPRVRRLRARRSAPAGLRHRLSGETPAGRVRLAIIDALAQLGCELGACVDFALQLPDGEIALAADVTRFAILSPDRSIVASDAAALLRGGIPHAAVIVDLGAITRAVLEKDVPE